MANKGLVHEGSLSEGIKKRDLENGRKMFGAAACFTCHRFGNEGGMTGPDLTSAGRRYSVKDLIEQIVTPSKEINEPFVPIEVITEDDERIRGVVVNLGGDTITLNTMMKVSMANETGFPCGLSHTVGELCLKTPVCIKNSDAASGLFLGSREILIRMGLRNTLEIFTT